MTTRPGHWSFTRWKTVGELEALEVHHPLFRSRLFLQGAHLAQFATHDEPEWLWLSETARFETGRAIRGGIPLCWPWFGVPSRNPPEVRKRIRSKDSHGFARTALWKLEDVRESAHDVEIFLSLAANNDFMDAWDGHALLLATFNFSVSGCQIALTTTNLGTTPLAYTQALHTYLPTPDIDRTRIQGLEGSDYIDTLQDWSYHQQKGDLVFDGETDRIYESGSSLVVATPRCRRTLNAIGSDSTVVWNPGPAKARTLSDFPDTDWKSMLCVETANALSDYRVLNEGQSHTLGVLIGRT
ncbi:D-hexose-6-phosphate mutarotase [Marinobacter sp.]|uniref:D-hexose-6-phosphate mutarotase n=1 Tax=Marinobacter sp. TaxID=50741 RepID=UPI0034A57AA6